MASVYSALLEMRLLAEETLDASVDPGTSGTLPVEIANVTGGRRWSTGTGSGKIGRSYKRVRTVGSGVTDSYDLLAAGSLTTPAGAAIDLDELKGVVIRVTSGQVQLAAPAANFLTIFADASGAINMGAVAGLRAIALDFGPDGLDVSVNSKFDVIETSGAATATYEIEFVGAE